MKNKLYKSLFLGISSAIAATASYALISPKNIEPNNITTTLLLPKVKSTTTLISLPVVSDPIVSENTDLSDSEPTLINTPVNTPVNIPASTTLAPKLKTVVHKIKKGESLSSIFSKLKLKQIDLYNIIHAKENGNQFRSIAANKELIAHIDSNNVLKQLVYKKDFITSIIATRSKEAFDIEVISTPIEIKIASVQTTIKSSLFLDGKEAGFSDKLTMQLAKIFGWDIDFALSLRKNDQITVVYEKLYVDGKEFGTGNILSAEFVNQGTSFTAVRFEDDQGNTGYYTPNGKSMRKAFLRTPVHFARISSHFNLKRKHPVLNKIRAHKGVDYAARTGTAIKSTGNGKIIFRGNKGGYGRVVIVQHGKKYSTLYAHLSKFKKGQRTGSTIKQGQVIGYVGRSGLATGSHLHYEFLVNGKHQNPLTVKLPLSQPIKESLLAKFKQQTQPLVAQLDKVKATTLLAENTQ
ncbi:MAG: peptidoglycan DD-metalloendopeptidase family protein [Methylococcales bacterium]|nr:peptidoglycan DD-metalloendopeptidase family protein [Methylococcales bacterium]